MRWAAVASYEVEGGAARWGITAPDGASHHAGCRGLLRGRRNGAAVPSAEGRLVGETAERDVCRAHVYSSHNLVDEWINSHRSSTNPRTSLPLPQRTLLLVCGHRQVIKGKRQQIRPLGMPAMMPEGWQQRARQAKCARPDVAEPPLHEAAPCAWSAAHEAAAERDVCVF